MTIPRMKRPRMMRLAFIMAWLSACWAMPADAQPPAPLPEDPAYAPEAAAAAIDPKTDEILGMDIEQLGQVDVVVPAMDVEVTSVTRTESTVGRSATAVFVITPEMIRRSGATSVPEVLRMAPGLNVARINSGNWAVSSRGFNFRFANKLLVQIDGRSVYTPTFSGVYWEANDVMLEDVERIEVIRGPGATVWGANAVNGVINIITKKAADTQGALITGGAGTEERGFTGARYGGSAGDLNWRVYGKQFDRDQGHLPGGIAADDWRMAQTGVRADWTPTACDTFTLQGDYFNGENGVNQHRFAPGFPFQTTVTDDIELFGGNVLGRWTRDLGEDRSWALQMYYDRFARHFSVLDQCQDIFDLDFQYQFYFGPRHHVVWGAGYRYNKDCMMGGFQVSFVPPARETNLFSYFVQDEIALREDELFLTLGSKFEHNSFTGFEFQPSTRLLYSPDPRRAVWGAVSRAVRTPARSDDDMRNIVRTIPMGPPPPVFVQYQGDRSVESEDLMAYELGYRAQPTDDFSWDIAAFFNKYEDLIVFNPTAMGSPPPAIWPWVATNGMDGETYGFELASTYHLSPCWRLTGSYSYLQMQLHAAAGITPRTEESEGQSPHSQFYVRSSWDMAHDLELDLMLRYVDSLHWVSSDIPSYFTMDVRLGWRPTEHLEMAVVGQNLLDDHHYEFFDSDALATEVDRGAYGTVTLRY